MVTWTWCSSSQHCCPAKIHTDYILLDILNSFLDQSSFSPLVCYCRVYDSNVNTRKSMTNLFGLKGRCPPLWTDFYVITQWLSACLKCFDYRIFTLFFSGSFSQVFSVAKTDTRTLLALRWRELSTSWANSLWSLQQRFFKYQNLSFTQNGKKVWFNIVCLSTGNFLSTKGKRQTNVNFSFILACRNQTFHLQKLYKSKIN